MALATVNSLVGEVYGDYLGGTPSLRSSDVALTMNGNKRRGAYARRVAHTGSSQEAQPSRLSFLDLWATSTLSEGSCRSRRSWKPHDSTTGIQTLPITASASSQLFRCSEVGID